MKWTDRLTSLMLEGAKEQIRQSSPPGATTQDIDSMEGAKGRLRSARAGGPRREQAARAREVHKLPSLDDLKANLRGTSTSGTN